ncbi:peroxiredoxin [Lacibacter cauensis]|uniref:Peroxiredoxin n=1 Tax=Lacibacter cauensis TaxID=510947 RepID=A0A562SYM2_9BACT|nr:TlpA disulfide reductase family protein [Lacibacter cauensis]TWI85750.1 peroxiredoxin [Lacibacter cauensis]
MNRRILFLLTAAVIVVILLPFLAKTQTHSKISRTLKNLSISGYVHGFKDSSWLYLDDAEKLGTALDSAQVMDERFILKIKNKNNAAPKYYAIRTKSFSEYKFFWVENSALTFSGVKGQLKDAIIDGSDFQRKLESLYRQTKPYEVLIDSLRRNYGTVDSAIWKQILSLEEELTNINIRFVKSNASSVTAAYILSVYCKGWGRKISDSLYRQLAVQAKQSEYGQKAEQYIKLNKEIAVGSSYADFALPDTSGQTVKLSSLKGKYTLLEFWASWCGPCRRDNPHLVSLYDKYKQHGFELLGVSVDISASQWKKAIVTDKLPWPNVMTKKGSDDIVALQYGIFEIPTNYLVNAEGKIIAKNVRGKELAKKLNDLFGH